MKHLIPTLLGAALLVALPACNKIPSTDALTAAVAGADDQAGDQAWDEKVQAYIEIGNRMRGFSSPMNATFAEWRARDAAKVEAGDFKAIRTDSHFFSDSDVQNLKDAAAMAGATPELDEAANALLAALEQGLPAWSELQDYNKAKRYEDDGGAKGKELLPKYRDGIAAIESAVDALAVQVDVAAKLAHEKTVARFKADGQLLELHTWEALGSAEKVIDLFNSTDDFKNEAKIEEANAHIAAMEASITAMRGEHDKRKAEDADSLPTIDRYESLAEELSELAGNYREARKDPSEFNDVVESYNDAVDMLNMMNS